MLKKEDFTPFHGKELTTEDKKFKLEFDEKRRCFRLYQKATIGMKNIDADTQAGFEDSLSKNYYLERINRPLPYHGYLLLDGTTLQALISSGKLKGISQESLNNLVNKKSQNKKLY